MKGDSSDKFKSLFEYYGFIERERKKYPVISRILKQLTPEKIKREIESVQKVKLPPELQKWVKEYEKVGDRSEFIWKWLYKMNEISSFFKVPKKYFFPLVKVKTLFNMFIILVDDVSERDQEDLLDNLLKVPFYRSCIKNQNLSSDEKLYLNFTIKVWKEIMNIIKNFPEYNKHQKMFYFDVYQVLNEVRYAYLIYKNPFLINELEYWIYFPQGMQIIVDFDLDLMCFEKIELENLGNLRRIVLILQKMARVGNWLSTWSREIKHGDFTGGVFAYALGRGVIKTRDLLDSRSSMEKQKKIIKKIKISKAEKYLLCEWEKDYKFLKKIGKDLEQINLNKKLKKFSYLLYMHLISQGYK